MRARDPGDRVDLRIRRPCRKMKRIIASPRLCTLLDISVQRSPDSDILMPKGSATVPAMYRRYLGLCMHAHERVYARGLRAPNIRTVNHSAHLLIIEDEPPCEIGPVLEGARGVTGSKLDQGGYREVG